MADEESTSSGISLDFLRTYKFFYGFLLIGLVLVLLGQWYHHPLAALLWSLAWLAFGGFLGFLFGIPRVLQQEGAPAPQQPNPNAPSSPGSPSSQADYKLRVNTNLEQISDWLTKIIVGLTLIQLSKIPDNLNRATLFMSYSLGGIEQKSFAGGILLFFSIGGFLGGYLFTRLFLTRAFYYADQPGLQISQSQKAAIANTQLSLQDASTQQLTGTAAQAAKQILNKPLEQLTSTSDIAVWAKAQLSAGNSEAALEGYNKAIQQAPNDVKLRLERAIASSEAGMPINQVKEQLLDAYRRLTPQTEKDIKASLYKELTYTFLYLPPPEGFRGAIQYGEEYVNDPSNPKDGAIYVNLAAAYGQKYRWYKEHPDQTVNLQELRNKALNAIKAALAIDQSWQTKLRMLLDPTYPNKDPKEDDLEVFVDDPEFRTILGMPQSAQPSLDQKAGATGTNEPTQNEGGKGSSQT